MAAGNVRHGLEGLDRLNWIKEGQSDYLENAAAEFLQLTDQGRDLDCCLAMSFTWDENHRFTEAIRSALKERGILPAEGTRLTVHESLRWTSQQKRDWQRYEPGQAVTFAPSSNRLEKEKVVVALRSRKPILNRISAWKRLAAYMAQGIASRLCLYCRETGKRSPLV
jgi:hypothetical protein